MDKKNEELTELVAAQVHTIAGLTDENERLRNTITGMQSRMGAKIMAEARDSAMGQDVAPVVTVDTPTIKQLAAQLDSDEKWTVAEQKAFAPFLAQFPNECSQGIQSLGSAWKHGIAYAQSISAAPQQHAQAIHQFRKASCSDWYDGYPDNEDGGGPYEVRTLYMQQHAQAALSDATLQLIIEAVGQARNQRLSPVGTRLLVRRLALGASQQPAAAPSAPDLIGLAVSMDVSTGDADAAHRYFGKVDAVQECAGERGGIILLVQDPKPNFATPSTPPQEAAARDERATFEAHFTAEGWDAHAFERYNVYDPDDTRGYKSRHVSDMWDGWQARAALASPAAQVAVLDFDSIGANLRIEQTDPGRWVVCVENWYPDDDSARAACRKWKAAYTSAPPIKVMVDRFLGWPLPSDLSPDCGISFDGRKDDQWNKNKTWPTGTNLFSADQAKAMFEHCIAAAPSPAQPAHAELPIVLELPEGDTRTAKAWWHEVKDGKRHICISISQPAPGADAAQGDALSQQADLPEPVYLGGDEAFGDAVTGYTAEHIMEARQQGRAAGLEEAASICARDAANNVIRAGAAAADRCASQIRALNKQEPTA